MLIDCCLFVRDDLSQERAVLVMLRDNSRWERRMLWVMVSKAASCEIEENVEVTGV